MNDSPPGNAALEKKIQALQKKLERSEDYRSTLEDLRERDQWFYLKLQEEVESARREMEIEAALERVRSRTMAMKSSDELSEVSLLLDQEVRGLGTETWGCAFNIYGAHDSTEWFGSEAGIDNPYKTPREKFFLRFYEKGQEGEAFYVEEFAGDKCRQHYDYMKSLPVLGDMLRGVEASGHSLPSYQVDHVAYFRYGYLLFITMGPVPEVHDIFKRFAAVFEQTYTRFLDLQSAEAQAREAQIEAALERVRSRAMAMRSSDELREMVLVILKEMKALAFPSGRCTIVLFDRETGDSQFWMSGLTDADLPERYHVPYHELPTYKALHDGWRDGIPFFEIELAGEVKREQDRFFHEESEFSRLPEPAKEGMRRMGNLWLSNASTTHGVVQAVGPQPLSEDKAAILQRFAKVIDLTYTRVEDIQQSEEQVREAQIETALERVRSRSMGMRKSDELKDIIRVVHDQLVDLGILVDHAGFIVDYKNRDDMHIWLADPNEVPFELFIPYFDSPHWNSMRDAMEKGESSFVNNLNFEEKNQFYKQLFEIIPGVAPEAQEFYYACQGLSISTVLMENVGLYVENFSARPYTENENGILLRFGNVFQQTYIRYLDLEQAEARAREAQIETSMERVRSRALAMTTSEELLDVIFKIHQEFIVLGLPCEMFWQTRYTPEVYQKALTGVGGTKITAVMELPRDFTNAPELAAWERGDAKIGVFKFDADAASEYLHHMVTKGQFLEVDPEGITEEMVREMGGFTFVQARTSHGEIGYSLAGETEPSEEAKDVLVRFTSAFDLAYRRFEDLQKAEADHQIILEEKALTEQTLEELRATQKQLVHSEKMASLGALTAGIAHEIKNPLNFVNNFASLLRELVDELEEETDPGERLSLLADLKTNAAMIEEHGKRADGIVRSMMQHASGKAESRRPVMINQMVEEYINLAYHGKRANQPDANAAIERDLGKDIGEIMIAGQDIGRVLINLINNAFDAVFERAASGEVRYEPTIRIATSREAEYVAIRVSDNGGGVPDDVKERVFEPFFTTKPTGQGTGLGLSMSYDIVTQGHGGTLTVESEQGVGSTFVVRLPV